MNVLYLILVSLNENEFWQKKSNTIRVRYHASAIFACNEKKKFKAEQNYDLEILNI